MRSVGKCIVPLSPQSRTTAYCISVNRNLGWGSPEPQPESGYPHIHAGFFTEFTDAEKDRLKNHSSRIVKAGDFKHGLDFSFEKTHTIGDVSSLRNYLMKYLAKTFVETIPDWTPEELVFNAIAWKEGYRFFGCSRDLSKAMKRPDKKNRGFLWLRTLLHRDDRGDEEDKVIRKNPTWKIRSSNECN